MLVIVLWGKRRSEMRNEPNLRINKYRSNDNPIGAFCHQYNWGYFDIERQGSLLRVISSGTSEETGWEHVSVSLHNRCPTWEEMCYIKNLFWKEEETVIQFHPKKSKYTNHFPYVLHLWRKLDGEHELPPEVCI